MSAIVALALTACSSNPLAGINPFKTKEDESKRGTVGFVEGFYGGVAADEPRAALVGRDILSAGGSMADAAAAVALTLSVTMPSSANLGGGGVCVVHDIKSGRTETLDFQAAVPSRIPPTATNPTAVPGLVRGIAALHAKYGRLPWAQVVAPAEQFARFGIQVSRALAEDLRKTSPATFADPDMRKIFTAAAGGAVVKEGDFITQIDLSGVLARLRARGAGDLYGGLLAKQFVAAVAGAGGSLSVEDMRNFTPQWRPTVAVPYVKNTVFHFASPPGPSGVLAAQMMAMLLKRGDWEKAPAATRAHMLAEVSGRAFAGRDRWLGADGRVAAKPETLTDEATAERLLAGYREDRHTALPAAARGASEDPDNPTGAGFVVADRDGSGAACTLSLNNLFGAGRVARGTGIVLAALPGPRGRGPDALAPMLLVNNLQNVFYMAAEATGGKASPSALVNVVAWTLLGKVDEKLEPAIFAKRVANDGAPGTTFYEQGIDPAVAQSLAGKGHPVAAATGIGRVNALFCPTGVPNRDGVSCTVKTDPRGFGLAVGGE